MSVPRRIVIVGAGLAGASAARTLRNEGFDGQMVLVGAERHVPYERPPLSKDYLRGESQRSDAYVESEQYWVDHDIDLRTGIAATRIDRGAGMLTLADGAELAFDRLLLAPGAEPRTLPGSDADRHGVVTLRTFADADTLRDRARQAERILVVGGGWIGSEVAASLRVLGHNVTWAFHDRLPLEDALGPDIGKVYRGLHGQHGVEMVAEIHVVALDGSGGARQARTATDAVLEADLVVVAIGADPRTELARGAGLTVTAGIVVDERLATSDARIFAAGDAALVPHATFGRSLRVEHWGAARSQGRHAARAMLGDERPYDELPYYFSDQYDTGMEFWGDPSVPGEPIVRGDPAARSFTALWHDAGRVRAVLNMHVHHHHHGNAHGTGHGGGHLDRSAVERLIRSTDRVEIERLVDPDVPLDALAGR